MAAIMKALMRAIAGPLSRRLVRRNEGMQRRPTEIRLPVIRAGGIPKYWMLWCNGDVRVNSPPLEGRLLKANDGAPDPSQ